MMSFSNINSINWSRVSNRLVISVAMAIIVGLSMLPRQTQYILATNPSDLIEAGYDPHEFTQTQAQSLEDSKFLIWIRRDLPIEFFRIGIPLVTDGKDCVVTIHLNGLQSEALPCDRIATLPDHTYFTFRQPIGVGQKLLSLRVSKAGDKNTPRIKLIASNPSKIVQARLRKEDTSSLSAISSFVRAKPLRGGLYIGCIAILIFVLLLRKIPFCISPLVLATVWIGSALSAATLSGYDETAHLDMFFLEGDRGATASEITEESTRFYKEASKVMHEDGFFLMHGVFPQPDSLCPHFILYRCGQSEKPRFLYSRYQKVLSFLGISLDHPRELLWTGRLINLTWAFSLLGFIYWIGGRALLTSCIPLLLATGMILAQLPSITNEFPLLCLGFLGAVLFAKSCIDSQQHRVFWGWSVWLLIFSQTYRIDRSWLAGLAVIAFGTWLLGSSRRWGPSSLSTTPDSSQPWRQLAKNVGLALLSAAVLLVLIFIATSTPTVQALLGDSKRWAPVLGLNTFSLSEIASLVSIHGKSFLGTFVWGHSGYTSLSYGTLCIFLLTAALRGAESLLPSRKQAMVSLFVGWGAAAALYLVMVVAIAHHFYKAEFSDHLASARFTALAMGIPLFFPLLGCLKWVYSGHSMTLVRMSAVWGLTLLLLEFPKVYLAPVY